MSVESGMGEALVMGPDSEGSEPPKLTMVNGDLGKLKTGKLQITVIIVLSLYEHVWYLLFLSVFSFEGGGAVNKMPFVSIIFIVVSV
jgi:hypothetical protein